MSSPAKLTRSWVRNAAEVAAWARQLRAEHFPMLDQLYQQGPRALEGALRDAGLSDGAVRWTLDQVGERGLVGAAETVRTHIAFEERGQVPALETFPEDEPQQAQPPAAPARVQPTRTAPAKAAPVTAAAPAPKAAPAAKSKPMALKDGVLVSNPAKPDPRDSIVRSNHNERTLDKRIREAAAKAIQANPDLARNGRTHRAYDPIDVAMALAANDGGAIRLEGQGARRAAGKMYERLSQQEAERAADEAIYSQQTPETLAIEAGAMDATREERQSMSIDEAVDAARTALGME